MTDPHAQTIAHLRLIAMAPGYWELRALERVSGQQEMRPRGSYFLLYAAGTSGIPEEQMLRALEWADRQDERGAAIFAGMNPRTREGGKSKVDVATLTACYTDLDVHGEPIDDALAALQTFSKSQRRDVHVPSF